MEEFSKISDILNDAVFDKNAYASSMKKAVAFGFWKNICGSRFSNFSVPYDIKGSTLYVAVKNPAVMQELIFYKNNLLSKIKDYFLPLNVRVEDIRYDYKVWNKVTASSVLNGDESLREYDEEEIDEVPLLPYEKAELSKVTDTISTMPFLNGIQKERYSKNIINSIKVQKLRARKGDIN